jgi:hypothetical protein
MLDGVTDEQLEAQHRKTRDLAAVIARVERERDGVGTPVQVAMASFTEECLHGADKDLLRENDLTDHEDVNSATTVDGYLAALLEHGKATGGLFPAAISTLILSSIDPEHLCVLRKLPHGAVSVSRSWAHVAALRLPVHPAVVARVARLTTLALLNCRAVRDPLEPRRAPTAMPQPKKIVKVKSTEEAPPPKVNPPGPAAPEGREIAGFAQAKQLIQFRVDGQWVRIEAGEPLMLLVPTQAERDGMGASCDQAVVWLHGRGRRIPSNSVSVIRAAEYQRRKAEREQVHS